jgi:hypothetical protein
MTNPYYHTIFRVVFFCIVLRCICVGKGEELAYCKSMACLLTQYRDLPKLCQSFPTVVRSVQGFDDDRDHQQQYQQQWQQPFTQIQGSNTSAGGGSSPYSYYQGIPPHSER